MNSPSNRGHARPAARNIYLIGFSGTGKSHSGRLAAEALKLTFADTDEIIEKRAGKPIPRIFAEDGEPRFREMEEQVLKELSARHGLVVSTGGGMPVSADNRAVMRATGLVVRLRGTPETIHARLVRGEKTRNRTLRPMLGGEAPVDRIRELLTEREPAYADCDVTIDTDGRMPPDIAMDIAAAWRSATTEPPESHQVT
jgi:shikimate kinase